MLIQTKGIVFRTIKYSETSIITDIYTRKKGLRSYIVSGVRKAKPKFSHSLFQIMSQVDITAYDHEHKNLNRIKEIRSDYIYTNIPFNIKKSSIGTFMMELCQKSIKERESNLDMYEFLSDWFVFLDQYQKPMANLHMRFMIELSAQLGFQPMDNYNKEESPYFNMEEGYFTKNLMDGNYIMDDRSSYLLFQLIQTKRDDLSELRLSREARSLFLNQLIKFYRLHVENFPGLNSADVLSEVLS